MWCLFIRYDGYQPLSRPRQYGPSGNQELEEELLIHKSLKFSGQSKPFSSMVVSANKGIGGSTYGSAFTFCDPPSGTAKSERYRDADAWAGSWWYAGWFAVGRP
jgi:hypothetical protein